MSKAPQVLHFDNDRTAANNLARALDTNANAIERHVFPDGETLIKSPSCPRSVALYRPLHSPNEKLIELILAVSAIRDQGAERVILVAPYLPYMRQDKAFHAGEAVSQQIIGRLIATYVDAIIAVDPHLHRTRNLSTVFPGIVTKALSAAALIGKAVADSPLINKPVIMGPDEESEPWVKAAAKAAHCGWTVGRKERHGDRDVRVILPDSAKLEGRHAVIFDDVISSGRTICESILAALTKGASKVSVYATHILAAQPDIDAIYKAGATEIISCDSVPHATNRISLAPLLAEAVLECL